MTKEAEGILGPFVNSISAGDNIGAETAFNVAMATKVGNTLELKRKELASTFVKSMSVETNETD